MSDRKFDIEKYTDSSSSKSEPLSLQELFTPPLADGFSIGWTLAGQGLLINLSFITAMVWGVFVDKRGIGPDILSFDTQSMTTAVYFSLPLIIGGFLLDRLPIKFFQDISRDTRVFVLRLLGCRSSPLTSFFIALLLSAAAGFSEEIFFRSIVQRLVATASGPEIGVVVSSVLFGLAHAPFWGANAIVESLIGAVFGYAYIVSGYNLAVPVAIHTLYDLFTMFGTWIYAKEDLNNRILSAAKEEARRIDNMSPKEFEDIISAIFYMMDFNHDGFIQREELEAGLKLYGYGMLPFSSKSSTEAIFDRADTNKDGKIDLPEFDAIIRDDIKNIKTWAK